MWRPRDRERYIGSYDPEHEMPDPDRSPGDRWQSDAYRHGARDGRFAYRLDPNRFENRFNDQRDYEPEYDMRWRRDARDLDRGGYGRGGYEANYAGGGYRDQDRGGYGFGGRDYDRGRYGGDYGFDRDYGRDSSRDYNRGYNRDYNRDYQGGGAGHFDRDRIYGADRGWDYDREDRYASHFDERDRWDRWDRDRDERWRGRR